MTGSNPDNRYRPVTPREITSTEDSFSVSVSVAASGPFEMTPQDASCLHCDCVSVGRYPLCCHCQLDVRCGYDPEVDGVYDDPEVADHAFNRAVRDTDAIRSQICEQRGGEYQDSWALENVNTPVFDSTLLAVLNRRDELGHPDQLSRQERRLLVVAALCDVKISRYGGPFKRDTPVDLANYLMAHATWMSEYLGD